ncbi:MAG: hypothetical protein Q4A82_06270 [Corynebacterium sp.]|nr:hypothetical protein [Corynebacterium sp.]
MINTKRTVVGLIIFGVAVLVSGWVGPHIYDLREERSLRGLTGYLSYGEIVRLFPLFFLVLVLAAFSGGWREMGLAFNFRDNRVTYLLFILAYTTVMTVSIVIGFVVNALSFSTLHLEFYLKIVAHNLILFLPAVPAAEIIWRGYLTNQLMKLRLKSWHIYLITTGLWWLWWFPVWNSTMIKNYYFSEFNVPGVTVVVVTLFMFFCWSVFYTEAFRLTRSIWPGMITYFFMSVCNMREFVKEITSADIVFLVLVPSALLGVIGFIIGRHERLPHGNLGLLMVHNRKVICLVSFLFIIVFGVVSAAIYHFGVERPWFVSIHRAMTEY